MNPTFRKRFPAFATGLLLGLGFVMIYLQQRHIAASVEQLAETQKDLGSLAADQKIALSLPLDAPWVKSERFPVQVFLLEAQHANQDRKLLQHWALTGSLTSVELPALTAGQYVLMLDLVVCFAVAQEQGPPCKEQLQYYDFRTEAASSRVKVDLPLAPISL